MRVRIRVRVRLGVGLRHGGARPLLIFPGGEHKGARLATWAAAPVHLLRAIGTVGLLPELNGLSFETEE